MNNYHCMIYTLLIVPITAMPLTLHTQTFIEKIELVRRDEYAGSNLEMARSIFKGKYPKANDKERQQMISFFVHLIGLRREQFNNALRQQREKKTEMGK